MSVPTGLWPIEASLRYCFEIAQATPSNNVIKDMHFHAYKVLRRQWRMAVLASLNGVRPKNPVQVSFLVITRECSGAGLDWDNAYGGLKPLLDCLVMPSTRNPDGMGLIRDDNPKAMPYPPFIRQCKGKKSQSRTKIEIYEVDPEASTAPPTST